jgi:uncharacterized protein YdhG (YjbR/CyaY superfamily)
VSQADDGLPESDKEHDMAATTETSENAGLSADEKAAVKQRAAELRAEAKAGKTRAAGEKAVREAIAAMPDDDRVLAEGIDRIVAEVAPQLMPKTWYGFPAYTDAQGKVVVFFKAASKFTTRYATLGFEEAAQLDDGDLWVTSFALTRLTPAVEKTIADHIRRAAG